MFSDGVALGKKREVKGLELSFSIQHVAPRHV